MSPDSSLTADIAIAYSLFTLLERKLERRKKTCLINFWETSASIVQKHWLWLWSICGQDMWTARTCTHWGMEHGFPRQGEADVFASSLFSVGRTEPSHVCVSQWASLSECQQLWEHFLAFGFCEGGKKENTLLGGQIMLICKVVCQAIPIWGTMILSSKSCCTH